MKVITQGEFGLIWRKHYKTNNFNYRFEEKGSGIGGSDADKEIRWFMNKKFRLALLNNMNSNKEDVIDFTRYDVKAEEPESGSTRNWSLMGDINQKQTRPQDKPIPIVNLSDEAKSLIRKYYPELINVNSTKNSRQSEKSPEYSELTENLKKGWNTWDTKSVLTQVYLPECFSISVIPQIGSQNPL